MVKQPDAVHVRPARPWTPFTPWLAGMLVLVPFVTVPLPLTLGHRVQAVAISGLVLGSIAWAWVQGRFRNGWPSLSHPVVAGVSLWAGAVVLGLVVAIFRGNEPVLIAGQVLSMALLPAGALAGWGLGRDPWPGLARGILVGGAIAVLIHLAYWGYQLSQGVIRARLMLPNYINLSGIALLGLLLALALVAADQGVWHVRGKLAAGAFLLFILGSGTRGLWLVTPPTLVLMGFVARGPRLRHDVRILCRAIPVLLALGLLIVPLLSWWHGPHPVTATTADFVDDNVTVYAPGLTAEDGKTPVFDWQPRSLEDRADLRGRVPVEGRRGYRLAGLVSGRGQGLVQVHLFWLDRQQRRVGSRRQTIALTDDQSLRIAGVAPANACWVRVTVSYVGESGAQVQVSDLTFEDLGSPLLTVAGEIVVVSLQRLRHTARVVSGREPPLEPSLAFRVSETRHLVDHVRRSSWWARLLGHGLGATSEYPGFGFDGEGRWRRLGRIHYVHNFYIFALYKLGLVGLVLLISALVLWFGWTASAARRHRGSPAGRFLAAMAAVWAGYAVWSLTSPEFLNFRMAPLWGLLLAAGVRAEIAREREQPPLPGDCPP